jgi:hypothetical protein
MIVQSDGNLVLYSGATPVWASNTNGHPGAYLSVENNGDIGVYAGTTALWAAHPTLQANGVLVPGESLPSANGQYRLTLQADGNLVKYNSSGTAIWSSGTMGMGVTALDMQSDGNLVLYSGATPVWASNTTGNPGAHLSLQDDGSLAIFSGTTQVWVR